MPFVQKLANIDKGQGLFSFFARSPKSTCSGGIPNNTAQRFIDCYIDVGCSAESRIRHDFTNFIGQMVSGYQILFRSSQKFCSLRENAFAVVREEAAGRRQAF